MKVKVIAGDGAIASAISFGRRSRESIDRNIDRLRTFSRNLRPEASERIIAIEDKLNRYLDSDVKDALRSANSNRSAAFRDDIIMFLADQKSIADTPPSMRRYLLANRRLGSLFRQQRLDAWGLKPGFLGIEPGEEDPYYVAVMNGVIQESEDKFYSEYRLGDSVVDGEILSIDEQTDVIATWNRIDELLDESVDPTSPLGESL